MTTPATIKLAACAKLNLALSVGPPTPPKGYHPIASWFAAIDLCDDLTLTWIDSAAPSTHTIRWAADAPCPTPIDWPIEKDLAVRAHRLLEERVGRGLPIAMTLEKRVPVGGGLGGGSSDAAAMLIGLNRLFALALPGDELRSLSTRLGSDVAFFLDEASMAAFPRPAFVAGFGERIERIGDANPAQAAVLMFPPFGCPTGPVYQAFDRLAQRAVDERRVRALIANAVKAGRIEPSAPFNDLAEPACLVEPRLRQAIADLQAAVGAGHRIHVTGSGSTLFALMEPIEAAAVMARCRKARPDVAATICTFVGSAGRPG